jgi:hypothetical protein
MSTATWGDVAAQRNTQPILAEDLAPLLATAAGIERITAPIAAVDLDSLLSQTRPDGATIDLGDLLRAELAADDARVPAWRFAMSPTRLFVIAISFVATLGIGIGLLVGS